MKSCQTLIGTEVHYRFDIDMHGFTGVLWDNCLESSSDKLPILVRISQTKWSFPSIMHHVLDTKPHARQPSSLGSMLLNSPCSASSYATTKSCVGLSSICHDKLELELHHCYVHKCDNRTEVCHTRTHAMRCLVQQRVLFLRLVFAPWV